LQVPYDIPSLAQTWPPEHPAGPTQATDAPGVQTFIVGELQAQAARQAARRARVMASTLYAPGAQVDPAMTRSHPMFMFAGVTSGTCASVLRALERGA
jgi:hypothetical protein